MLETLIAAFETIEDPRCEWKIEHRLLDILVIAVCAVLGEAESFEDIALYGRCKRQWLEGFLALPNGIPSHDTFRRVLMLVDPDAFDDGHGRLVRHYLSSAALPPEARAAAIRNHWRVENGLHWVLDVTFREDACRVASGTRPATWRSCA